MHEDTGFSDRQVFLFNAANRTLQKQDISPSAHSLKSMFDIIFYSSLLISLWFLFISVSFSYWKSFMLHFVHNDG